MKKIPIRNLHSDRQVAPCFCCVVIEGDKVYLERKKDKNNYEKILWDDVVYQVEAAKAVNQ